MDDPLSDQPDTIEAGATPEPVGYKRPPVASRFPKGVSGNRKGRPPGRRSLRTELREVLDAKVVVQENGRKAKISTRHAMLVRLRQQALAGDKRAIDRLLKLAAAYLPDEDVSDRETVLREDAELEASIRRDIESSIRSDRENPQ